MLFYKQVLEFYFTPMPTLGYSIFSKNDQIAALYCIKYFLWFGSMACESIRVSMRCFKVRLMYSNVKYKPRRGQTNPQANMKGKKDEVLAILTNC